MKTRFVKCAAKRASGQVTRKSRILQGRDRRTIAAMHGGADRFLVAENAYRLDVE